MISASGQRPRPGVCIPRTLIDGKTIQLRSLALLLRSSHVWPPPNHQSDGQAAHLAGVLCSRFVHTSGGLRMDAMLLCLSHFRYKQPFLLLQHHFQQMAMTPR